MDREILLFLLTSTVLLSGQELQENEFGDRVDSEFLDESCCTYEGPRSSSLSFRHLEYQGIGYNQGYSSFDLFLSNATPYLESSVFFLDLRGHVFNDGKPALNAGLGWRWFLDECKTLGMNFFYDYRKTKRKKYNQVGLGLEYLSPTWEVRANGYFPFGSTTSHPYDLKFSHFSGNHIFISQKYEFAMTGGDAEIGGSLVQTKFFDLFAGVGPYYFKGHFGHSAVGGKVRLEARITPFVTIEIGDSYDSVFHNRFHSEIALSIPLGPRAKVSGNCCSWQSEAAFLQRVHSSPNRQEIIVVDSKKKIREAINPLTGNSFFFLFVDNTSSSDGTFESPYSTLATAQTNASPGDVIYVFPGDGTTNGMDAGIDLSQPNTQSVHLLGSGVSHEFTTTRGTIEIPPQTLLLPSITNLNPAPIVVLGTNNEVSGFNVLNGSVGVSSISGIWNNVTASTNINRNNILFAGGTAIDLQPTNSQANLVVSGNTIFAPTNVGVNIPYVDSSGVAIVQNNFFDSSTTPVGGVGVEMIHRGVSNVTSQIMGNTFLNILQDTVHVDVEGTGMNANTIVSGNTIFYRIDDAFNYYAFHLSTGTDAIHSINVLNNHVDGPSPVGSQLSYRGLVAHVRANATALSNTQINVKNNSFHSGGEAIILYGEVGGSGALQAIIQENSLRSNFPTVGVPFPPINIIPAAISINANGQGPFLAVTNQNYITLTSNQSSMPGMSVQTTTAEVIFISAANIIYTGPGSPYRFECSGASGVIIANLQANVMVCDEVDAAEPAIVFNGNAGFISANITNCQLVSTTTPDLLATTHPNATICLGVHDNNFHGLNLDNSAGGTIYLEQPFNNSDEGFSVRGNVTYVPKGFCP